MPHLNERYEAWIGRMLTDALGHKIGKIDDIYTDDDTGQPEWLAVTTGLMGANTHFVPMRGATVCEGGVQVPFPKDQVKVAPSAGGDGRLARMEKGRLYAHYGYSYAEERNRLQRALGFDPPGLSRSADGRDVSQPAEQAAIGRPAAVRDTSQPVEQSEVSQPADARDVSQPVEQSEVSQPADARDVSQPVEQSEVSRRADLRDLSRPAERCDEAERLSSAGRDAGRGRWPDDEAIFGLSQEVPHPTLATSGASRRR